MHSYSKNYFGNLIKKLLDSLYEEPNELKIKRILETEQIVGLGFYADKIEFDINNFSDEINN